MFTQCSNKSTDPNIISISHEILEPDLAVTSEAAAIIENQSFKTILILESDVGTIDINLSNNVQSPVQILHTEEDLIREIKDISLLKQEFSQFKLDVKKTIKEEYGKIKLNLDKIFDILINHDQPNKQIIRTTIPKHDLLQDIRFPLMSCAEISLLEEHIRSDIEFRTQLVEFLSKIGGRTGVEDGSKVAYKVIDHVFTSEVLMNYSWTGISRGKSGEKKTFQILDGILGVFFEVISLADNRHTHQKNSAIFKEGVLKHAKKRTARKCASRPVENAEAPADGNVHVNEVEDNILVAYDA